MRIHRTAIAALALPLLAGCSNLVDNQTMGPPAPPVVPTGGALFSTYIALGTSISAGVQSAGLSDSTQKQSFPYLLAQAMGVTVGVNWTYPSFNNPGCPPPYTNPLTGARVTPTGYPPSTSTSCYLLNPAFIRPFTNLLGVPSIRAAQVLNILDLTYPASDTLPAAQFITGSRTPITELMEAKPTFVTLEIGADDILHAATHGNAALLTPLATFQTQFTAIADSIDKTGAKVAVANVPNITVIPHFSAGVVFFCLKTGAAGCPVPATAPYNLATFTVDASCAPTAAGGVGDQMLVGFTATATITGTLAGGGAASLNCGAATATVTDQTGTHATGPVLGAAAVAAIVTEGVQIDSFIHLQANQRGWAYVDLHGLLAANAALIPKFPNFHPTVPPTVDFGALFSLDGIHPTAAGQKAIADAFVLAIDAKFSTTLTPP
jgi:lysophospholipase L1-like esterase